MASMTAMVAANNSVASAAPLAPGAPSSAPAVDVGELLFAQNEHYELVDALPYIDTQLGQTEVAQQVKALIEEEMTHFEARDYLASLPEPDLPVLSRPEMLEEFARIEAAQPMRGIDISRYRVEAPRGNLEQDAAAWKQAAEMVQTQLEYSRLRLANLELLERWGNKAWVAGSMTVRACERILTTEAATLKAAREEVNKKRKLDQISCGNELRRLALELEQYQRDNVVVEHGLREIDAEVHRLVAAAKERGVKIHDLTGESVAEPEEKKAKAEELENKDEEGN